MSEITLKVSAQEVQIIATALQRTDPTGMYVGELIKKIVEQGNEQIKPPVEGKEVTQ